jgi:7-cyano-7-deazaguanine synthase
MKIYTKKLDSTPSYLEKIINDPQSIIKLEQERVKEYSERKEPLRGNRIILIPWSGGLDSTASLIMAIESGCSVKTVFFNYGQEYVEKENKTVQQLIKTISNSIEVTKERWKAHHVIDISILYKHTQKQFNGDWGHIFPLRNYILLKESSLLLKDISYSEIWFSCIQGEIPFSGGDKSIVFLAEMQKELLSENIILTTPLIGLNKSDIIRWSQQKNYRYEIIKNTLSCFNGETDVPCGKCQACFNRLVGFASAGVSKDVGFIPSPDNLSTFITKYKKLFQSESHYSITRKEDMLSLIDSLSKNDKCHNPQL